MPLKDILELVVLAAAALMIVANNFKAGRRVDAVVATVEKDAKRFRELCRMRHNPLDRDLMELKQEQKRQGEVLCRIEAVVCRELEK